MGVNMQDMTPLHIAARRGDLRTTQSLLAGGADANAKEVEVFALSSLYSLIDELTDALE